MSGVVGRAAAVIAVVFILCALAAVGLLAWCAVDVVRDRKRNRELDRRAAEAKAMAKGPAGDPAAMVRNRTPAPAVRQEPRNIPRGDGAFHADGLDEAIRQIMREGDRG